MSRIAPIPRTTTLSPCQLCRSYSHSLKFSLNFHHLGLHSRRIVISHAVRTRNVNNVTSKLGYEDEDDGVDDGVEFVRKRRRSRKRSRERQWWSGNNQVEGGQVGGILDQLVDGLWILKVFRSYGLFLPVILISLLLATGPKAFLLGSGIPFGLSLLAFAFNKLSQLLDFNPLPTRNPKSRRKRSRFSGRRDAPTQAEGSKARETQQGERTKSRNYQTRGSSFGGWDELVFEDETEETKMPSVTEARLEMMRERKVGRSMEKRDLPLVLRLLVALFPFLGSWINLL